MSKPVPVIGFDRYVELEWAGIAMDIANGTSEMDYLRETVGAVLTGAESQRKAIDVLKRLWIKPFAGLEDFIERGRKISIRLGQASILPLTWGSAIASYPFFSKTAEITGRLTALHGDCSYKEIQKRMAESYGDRNGIERSVARVLQTQAAWNVFTKDDESKRLIKRSPIVVEDEELILWMIESGVRSQEKLISISSIHMLPQMYPFELRSSLSYLVSQSASLAIRNDGPNNQVLELSI